MSGPAGELTRIAYVDMPSDYDIDEGIVGPYEFASLDEALDKVMIYVGPRLGLDKNRLAVMATDEKLSAAAKYFIEKSNDDEWVSAISILGPNLVLQCGNLEVLVRNAAAFGRSD